jgi:hypothetical protein
LKFISTFIDQWLGTALPQLFLLFLGILLVTVVVTALWDRRIKQLGGALGLVLGLFMTAVALEANLARFLGALDPSLRIRLLAVFLSLFFLSLTLVSWFKTGLKKSYVLTWLAVSLIVLLTALFPGLLHSFPSFLGIHYGLAVAGLFLVFLLLLAFHFSITLSELERNQSFLLQRLHALEGGKALDLESPPQVRRGLGWCRRPDRGTSLAAPLIILLAAGSVFTVGMAAPQVMVGDEVTHYYMLTTQAEVLPQPNFIANIPMGWDRIERRTYPHSFLWHYLGALFFRFSGGSFAAVQFYQSLFLVQFLGVAYVLARRRGGVQTRAALPYLLVLASLPMTLIFTVTLYQDVPMTAQVLTAFYLLHKQRWLLATCFLAFALGVKVNALLFFPAFLVCLLLWTARRCRPGQTVGIVLSSVLILSLSTWGLGSAITTHTGAKFYPVEKVQQLLRQVLTVKESRAGQQEEGAGATKAKVITEQKASIIANHPGDLRIKANYFIYGGLLLWFLVLGAGLAGLIRCWRPHSGEEAGEGSAWLWGVGLSYTLLAAFFLASAPDARFFLPGLPFLILPLAEKFVSLPKPKHCIALLASLAFLQGGYVLAKTYHLREVSPALQEAIAWMHENPPSPRKIFMYPEGNYRLFPVPHEWYLNYHLRSFWLGDNDLRLAVLHRFGIGAVVIKKDLVSPVDSQITNLGVYPDFFVQDLKQDERFRKVFENKAVLIFDIPAEE